MPIHDRPGKIWLLLPLLLWVWGSALGQTDTFAEQVQALDGRSFEAKNRAIETLAASEHPRTRRVLRAMLEGDLYARKDDGRIVIITGKQGRDYLLEDALTGEKLPPAGRRDVSRISVNNTLRSQIRSKLAQLSLMDPSPAVRLEAVQQLIDDLNPQNAQLLAQIIPGEEDSRVREAMDTALALTGLQDPDPGARLAAISTLEGNLNPEIRIRLNRLLAEEPEEMVKAAALDALDGIETRVAFYRWLETLFFGLSLGSVLFLAAIGLAITFGVMGVINMAHGELIMLGAYTTYVVQLLMPEAIGWSLLVAVPAAFLVSGLTGIAIERGIIRFLYGRPLETLLATFGLSLFLQQLVRSIFSPLNRSVTTPDWMQGTLEINPAFALTYNRLYILLFSLLVFAALLAILKHTSLGLKVRAVSQNRAMASAIGVRSQWVDAMTFGLGSGIAGVAGVALSQLTNVGPNLGQAYIVDSFLVVVFGGVGNLWGTLVSALSLGVVNKFLEPASGAVLAKILVLLFIILFIQKRPRGLFPQKGRAAEA
ncbi:MAG: urea ABC transporter permease subunit UrtB [Candidatus Competibacteraceae bacterium]|nr:urea ABC transporter permease subunit UrtB [Candidatus Competibacteraceae bacterium]